MKKIILMTLFLIGLGMSTKAQTGLVVSNTTNCNFSITAAYWDLTVTPGCTTRVASIFGIGSTSLPTLFSPAKGRAYKATVTSLSTFSTTIVGTPGIGVPCTAATISTFVMNGLVCSVSGRAVISFSSSCPGDNVVSITP